MDARFGVGTVVPRVPTAGEVDRTLAAVGQVRTVVLVEGASDKAAVETVALRLGIDIAARSVTVVSMGGITNIGRFIAHLGPGGRNLRLAGLCDANERPIVVRALRRNGFEDAEVETLESFGFFTCVRDLEDELIRALGVVAVEEVLAGTNELASFRIFQNQPAQREVDIASQLHRFLGTRSTRKIRAGHLLAQAVRIDLVPVPLRRLLDHVSDESTP